MPRLAATDIASVLRKRIHAGEWAERGRIPPERELASEFGVARNTVRRAVGLLQECGAVSRHVGRGTFLVAGDPDTLSAVVSRIAGSSPADIMEMRKLLEPAAAAFAATNASVAELNSVGEAHRAATGSELMPDFERWDAEFHHRIFSCSRNEFLKETHNLIRALRNQAPWYDMKKRSFSEERRARYCAEHQLVWEALQRRDPEGARAAMFRHLSTVQANMLGR